jgi:threonine synthase
MSIWRWAEWIDPVPEAARVTLGEGATPLVRSRRIGPTCGLDHLWFKLDCVSPTGSYKDRFAAAAISHMVARRQTRCFATSSGNTGAALAAYCAAAGIRCHIALVETAPAAKLKQMLAYGARLYRVRGMGKDAAVSQQTFDVVGKHGAAADAAVQISAYCRSPLGMSGVQTIAHELAEQAPAPIDHVFCQAGGGGLVLATARGFEVQREAGQIDRSPAVECVQPEGNDTIATPLRQGQDRARAVTCTTAVSGLQVPSVMDGNEVIRACRACGGTGHVVADADVWQMQARLAREEGIFAEPAAVITVAAAVQAARRGELKRDALVVCLITGSGFKDQPSVERMVPAGDVPLVDVAELDRLWSRDDA